MNNLYLLPNNLLVYDILTFDIILKATLFINRTIGELMFDGYEDELIAIGEAYAEEESVIPMDRFGWFYKV